VLVGNLLTRFIDERCREIKSILEPDPIELALFEALLESVGIFLDSCNVDSAFFPD
jgi:hypothetical protein